MSNNETIKDIATLKANSKNMASDVSEIKSAVYDLPEQLQKKFDERYARASDVKELQDTIEPFTQFKKKAWALLVATALAVGVLSISAADKIKDVLR